MNILKPRLYMSFEEALNNPKQVRRLQLYHPHKDCCLQNIKRFENLEELHLGWYSDNHLPDEIKSLSKLKTLVCLNMPLQAFPRWLFSCVTLQKLTVRGSDIRVIPNSIGRLFNLRELELGNNGLMAVPAAIGSLQKLKHLGLPDNGLSDLPVEFSQLSRLSSLGLVNNAFRRPEADKIRAWFRPGVVIL